MSKRASDSFLSKQRKRTWSQCLFRDPLKRVCKVVPIPPKPSGKYVEPGMLQISMHQSQEEKPTKETIFISGHSLTQIMEHDFSNRTWIQGAQSKKLLIEPSSHKNYQELVLFGEEMLRFSCSLHNFRELQACLQVIIPALYGFDLYTRASIPSDPLPFLNHNVNRKEQGRGLGITFNPPFSTLGDGRLLRGSYFFRFHDPAAFIGVRLNLGDIAKIYCHDFFKSSSHLTLTDSSQKSVVVMQISLEKTTSSYFFTAAQDDHRICFKLYENEFAHIRTLLKASLPAISGFSCVFNSL